MSSPKLFTSRLQLHKSIPCRGISQGAHLLCKLHVFQGGHPMVGAHCVAARRPLQELDANHATAAGAASLAAAAREGGVKGNNNCVL